MLKRLSILLLALCVAQGCVSGSRSSKLPPRDVPLPPPDMRPWSGPLHTERVIFELLLTRFDRFPAAVPPQAPVSDALASLRGPVAIDLGCGKIFVTTVLMNWQHREGKDGRYEWGGVLGRDSVDKHGTRTLNFVNVLSLNTQNIRRREKGSLRNRIEHMGLFYHELLHAQLLIDAMRNDPQWVEAYCLRDEVDFGPADLAVPEQRIPAFEKEYNRRLRRLVKNSKTF